MYRSIPPEQIIDILKHRQLLLRQYQDEARYVFAFVKFLFTPENNDYFYGLHGGIDYSSMDGITGGSGLSDLTETLQNVNKERNRQFNETVTSFQRAHDGYVLVGDIMNAFMSLTAEEKEVLSVLYMEGKSPSESKAQLMSRLNVSEPTIYRIRARAIEKIQKKLNRTERKEASSNETE